MHWHVQMYFSLILHLLRVLKSTRSGGGFHPKNIFRKIIIPALRQHPWSSIRLNFVIPSFCCGRIVTTFSWSVMIEILFYLLSKSLSIIEPAWRLICRFLFLKFSCRSRPSEPEPQPAWGPGTPWAWNVTKVLVSYFSYQVISFQQLHLVCFSYVMCIAQKPRHVFLISVFFMNFYFNFISRYFCSFLQSLFFFRRTFSPYPCILLYCYRRVLHMKCYDFITFIQTEWKRFPLQWCTTDSGFAPALPRIGLTSFPWVVTHLPTVPLLEAIIVFDKNPSTTFQLGSKHSDKPSTVLKHANHATVLLKRRVLSMAVAWQDPAPPLLQCCQEDKSPSHSPSLYFTSRQPVVTELWWFSSLIRQWPQCMDEDKLETIYVVSAASITDQ